MRFPPSRRWLALVALSLSLVLFVTGTAPAAPARAQESVVPSLSYETWYPVEQPPGFPFEVVQLVVDFPPGARVARHKHGGPGYITMLDSALTMWIGDSPVRTYQEDESFVEPFGLVAEGANLTPDQASVLVTYLLPIGAAVTTLEASGGPAQPAPLAGQLPPGSSPRFESRLRIEQAPAGYQVGQALRTYPAGAWGWSTVPTTQALLTVVEGEVTVLTGATERVYRVGEHWTEVPGQAILAGNPSNRPAVAAYSVIAKERP